MQWDDSPAGDFTAAGVRSWLPAGDVTRNVSDQRRDPGSVLWFCRELLRVRRTHAAGQLTDYEPRSAPDGGWHYEAGVLVVAANFTDQQVRLSEPVGEVLLSSAGARQESDAETLGPWEGVIASRPR